MDVDLTAPVYLVKGGDDALVSQAVGDLVHALVGDGDRTLMVDELDIARYAVGDDEFDVSPVADAAQTMPFLTERRVVVGRHLGMFGNKEAVAPLVTYLSDPLPSTSLVLVFESDPRPGTRSASTVPKSLAEAVKAAAGVVVDAATPKGKEQSSWIEAQVRESGLKLDAGARALLVDRLNGDLGRLRSVLESLTGTFGPRASLGVDDVEPYVGEGADLPPWDLTDAIDKGDMALAVERLQRMLGAKHPLQIMASLHSHYERMLRLDGSGVASEREAAELLGIKGSTYPARKALDGARRLGPDRLHQFIGLLARADLDLRGARAWPSELVVEVLVARLAGRSRQSSGRR